MAKKREGQIQINLWIADRLEEKLKAVETECGMDRTHTIRKLISDAWERLPANSKGLPVYKIDPQELQVVKDALRKLEDHGKKKTKEG